jgi:hypothetical protein
MWYVVLKLTIMYEQRVEFRVAAKMMDPDGYGYRNLNTARRIALIRAASFHSNSLGA